MSEPTRPVLRYHGGKWLLAPWIISLMPEHRTYVEPFGGGASVLMRKPRSYAEIYNDKWDTAVNVFRVLRDESKSRRLQSLLELTPFARTEMNISSDVEDSDDDVEMARKTIFRSFAGFGSAAANVRFSTGFRASVTRSGSTPAQDWMRYPQQVQLFLQRLQGVTIENKDALDVIRQHDGMDTLFFVDPPYVHSTRNMRRRNSSYVHEMSDADHGRLAELLHAVKGMVMLCGYDCDLYRKLYGSWDLFQCDALADGARPRIEHLWLNPAAMQKRDTVRTFFDEVPA